MCLINFQMHDHPNYKLIIAANRDEFYERPSAQAHFWEDEPNILAGRDLEQMGTWLGVTKQGRFAALTNFRNPKQVTDGKISRGEIIRSYLSGDGMPKDFLESLKRKCKYYDGFNVIVGDPDQLFYYSNTENNIKEITQGTHGLSNHLLNTPWPKVTKGKQKLKAYVSEQEEIRVNELFGILSDQEEARDSELPHTGISLKLERKLSSLFIKTADYGTRSSTVLFVDKHNHLTFVERTYDREGFIKENRFTFQIEER